MIYYLNSIVPSQEGTGLRVFDPAAQWAETGQVPLPARVVMTRALAGAAAMAVLLDDGQVLIASPPVSGSASRLERS